MKYLLAALSFAVLPAAGPRDQAVEGGAGDQRLSVAIVPSRSDSGASTIERDGVFSVRFTNHSEKPVRLWSERCRFGYQTLSFRYDDGSRRSSRMHRVAQSSSDWRNRPPKTVTIPPGATFSWEVAPSAIWGDREWHGVPEPNTGKSIALTAVYEVEATDAARAHGVWSGRIRSEPVETLIVEPKLRTPHQYLWAACPKQALRVIQGDPTWVQKTDDDQQTPLHLAARFGYLDVVRWLLTHGADANARAYNKFTPLHFAQDPEVVRLLLEHKADINARDSSNRTALEDAASWCAHLERDPEAGRRREKWRAIVTLLLKAGAHYDIRSACYLGDVERVRVLVADKKQARDKDAMRMAATYGRTKIVKLLLENGADPEDADYGGLTLSYFAIEHPEVLKLLFDAGADPKVAVTYRGSGFGPQGSTLLQEAAAKGAIDSVKVLQARGVNVDVNSPAGAAALHGACWEGQVSMVEWLLRNRAEPKAGIKDGVSAMSAAAGQVRPEPEEANARYQAVIRTLAGAGVEVDLFAAIACNDARRVAALLKADRKRANSKNSDGRPALQVACMLDRREIAELLLAHGCAADVRSEDSTSGYKGQTALLEAAFWGRTEMAELLIKHGAKVNAKAERGITPLHEAARMGNVEVARLLLTHGADVNAKDDQGHTPLAWGRSYRKLPEMSKLLSSYGGREKDAGK
jgi:ankyrin repeat protein